MYFPPTRLLNFLAAFTSGTLISVALYMQYEMGLYPCALCMAQRVFVITVGVFFLMAAFHNPSAFGQRIYALLCIIWAGIGSVFSIRHVWLQHLPEDEIPMSTCGADDFFYYFENFSFIDAIAKTWTGGAGCAKRVWEFLGLSIPEWTLIAFVGFITVGFIQLLRPHKQQKNLSK